MCFLEKLRVGSLVHRARLEGVYFVGAWRRDAPLGRVSIVVLRMTRSGLLIGGLIVGLGKRQTASAESDSSAATRVKLIGTGRLPNLREARCSPL